MYPVVYNHVAPESCQWHEPSEALGSALIYVVSVQGTASPHVEQLDELQQGCVGIANATFQICLSSFGAWGEVQCLKAV